MIDMDRVVMLYENPYIYDGWSVAEYEDGTFHNRWPETSHRHAPAEQYKAELEAYNERQGRDAHTL